MDDIWNEQFQEIAEGLIGSFASKDEADLNRVIWRLNEASMYMSRFLQYKLCGKSAWLPAEVRETMNTVGLMAKGISVAMEQWEENLTEENGNPTCLECLEEISLDDNGGIE